MAKQEYRVITVHDARRGPREMFQCEACGYATETKVGINNHHRTHVEEEENAAKEAESAKNAKREAGSDTNGEAEADAD